MIVYRLRAQDGTYVCGKHGAFGPSNRARRWKRVSDLKNHLVKRNQWAPKPNDPSIYNGKVVVVETCEITESPKDYIPVNDLIAEVEKRKREKAENVRIGRERHAKNLRRQQYEQLKKEFENA